MTRSLLTLLSALLIVLGAAACGGESAAPAADEAPEADVEVAADAEDDGWGLRNDPVAQRVEPFQIFDNLYYVGIEWVSSYLLVTTDGLILIGSLYGDFIDNAIDGIRAVGFDPSDLKYVLVTHGHFDHVGGAARFQEAYGARVGMTEADWELAESPPSDPRYEMDIPVHDMVIADGDTLQLGDTEIRFYVTPGHTEGVLSMEFPVRDGGEEHRAFVFGGVGLNFEGVHRTNLYLDSVARIQRLAGEEGNPIEVNITNHAGMGRIFERGEQLASRGPSDPHPFVDPRGFVDWLAEWQGKAERKLTVERELAGE
ncbi:MAG: MBL fold metallo-hydrolase [Acidobacteriota bacterium]|nr:MBL fold metallo-hydrolase [Acidobacteriota bacterium]MDE2924205.1 MBL fold metallo-hydrolase [Acidobacteriota bacterium]MDE3263855.1 MBL fold metallo-hydrolase [Acidobacteriota bacterium]